MDLKHFVLEALVQIAEGIKEAEEVGAGVRFHTPVGNGSVKNAGEHGCLSVSFDIAVAVTKDDKAAESEKLTVLSAGEPLEAGPHAGLSRIAFSVPLSLQGNTRRAELENTRPSPGIPDLDISL